MIRKATISDLSAVTKLAILLWRDNEFEELEKEIKEIISDKEAVVFLYFDEDTPIGFAQCQMRYDYVEGTDSSPVAYLEGVFVAENYRNRGIATKLLKQCELWALEKGAFEFASDCEITNTESYDFHIKYGFLEANRIVCFKKIIKTKQPVPCGRLFAGKE